MTTTPPVSERQTVLVVDDTPDNLSLLSGVLKDQYKVKVATSGERALEMLQAGPLPNIMLLDVMMPGIDGYEVLRRMREQAHLRELPVIFVTGMAAAEDEERGFGLGAVDYIVKPISPPTVLARIRTHLALSERTAMLKSLSEKLSHYLAPQVYRSIFEGTHDASIQTQRKKLTIFFSDIKDFTQASQDLEPEDLTALLNEYFTEMSRIALEYGATIDKFIGDAMLMFFGDPQTRGEREDALHCVHMAVAMQRRMVDLQAMWRERGYQQPFRMRIGINTGYCNVGNFGSSQRMDYTIIGAEVNLAARLEQIADPDGIMLSYETYALVRDEFEVEERPPTTAKGIAREIRCVALKNIDGEDAGRRNFVIKEQRGMRLTVNMALLTDESRAAAIGDLEEVLERMRRKG
jgi:adenylate cyclase